MVENVQVIKNFDPLTGDQQGRIYNNRRQIRDQRVQKRRIASKTEGRLKYFHKGTPFSKKVGRFAPRTQKIISR